MKVSRKEETTNEGEVIKRTTLEQGNLTAPNDVLRLLMQKTKRKKLYTFPVNDALVIKKEMSAPTNHPANLASKIMTKSFVSGNHSKEGK